MSIYDYFYPTESLHQSKNRKYMVVKPQCIYGRQHKFHIQLKEVQSKQIEALHI